MNISTLDVSLLIRIVFIMTTNSYSGGFLIFKNFYKLMPLTHNNITKFSIGHCRAWRDLVA